MITEINLSIKLIVDGKFKYLYMYFTKTQKIEEVEEEQSTKHQFSPLAHSFILKTLWLF